MNSQANKEISDNIYSFYNLGYNFFGYNTYILGYNISNNFDRLANRDQIYFRSLSYFYNNFDKLANRDQLYFRSLSHWLMKKKSAMENESEYLITSNDVCV